MAMLPFCGYHMADYFAHWLALGRMLQARGAPLPRIYTTNWFRKDDQGRFVWPGFGENMRVLRWMLDRIDGRAAGVEHPLGIGPAFGEINWQGLDFGVDRFEAVTRVDPAAWRAELALHDELFAMLGERVPAALRQVRARLANRLEG